MTLSETVEEVALGINEEGEVRIVALKGRGRATQMRGRTAMIPHERKRPAA